MDLAVKSASASFEAGQYGLAAEKFAEAFGYIKNYTLKKNEMVAWFKAGDCPAAVDAGRVYLSGDGNITKRDRGDVKTVSVRCLLIRAKKFLSLGRLEKCELQLSEAESLIVADTYSPISGSDESGEIQVMRDQISAIKKRETPEVERAPSSILGPVITISGGALALGGGIFILLSRGIEDEFTCTKNIAIPSCDVPTREVTPSEFEDAKSSANLFNTIGWIGVAGGVAMSGLGIYLWTTEGSESSLDSARLVIEPSQQRVGVEFVF